MPTYQYRLLQLPVGGTMSRLNEQIRQMAEEGWEPMLMSGEATVNILLRRGASAEEMQQKTMSAAVAEPVG